MHYCNIYRDAVLTSSVNCFTSFLAGFAVFSVLGHMARMQGTDVENVARDGKYLNLTQPLYVEYIMSVFESFSKNVYIAG